MLNLVENIHMLSLELIKTLDIEGFSLLIDNGTSMSAINTYNGELCIIMPDFTVIGPIRLGSEKEYSSFRFSDSIITKDGFYISHYDNEVRIRKSQKSPWGLGACILKLRTHGISDNIFALNSRNNLYIIDDKGCIYVYDANVYSNSRNPLNLLFTKRLFLTAEFSIITIDKYDNVYISSDEDDKIRVYDPDCTNILFEINDLTDIWSIKVVGDHLYVDAVGMKIYNISNK